MDTELVPLKREANDPLGIAVPFRRSAPWWRWLLSASLGIGIVYAVTNGHIIFGIACAGLLVWLIYRAPNRNAPLSELQGELSHLLVILGDVRREVAIGAYNASVLSERLKRAETQGIVIPSIAYSLLKLRASQEAV